MTLIEEAARTLPRSAVPVEPNTSPSYPAAAAASYRFAFVMDQQVGLRTQAMNLERAVTLDSEVDPLWVPVRYAADAGWLSRLPLLPAGMRGTLRGVREVRQAITGQHFDAVLWATWAAKSVPDLVKTAPAFLAMDMTPTQMEAMGSLYGYGRMRARLLRGWKRRATARLYQRALHLFPWSTFVAESLIGDYGVPAEKVTVVSPGVDTDLYHPEPAARSRFGTVRLLFVGGDFVRKGGDLLLRWMREREAAPESPAVELHLVTRDAVPEPLPEGVFVHRNLANNSTDLVRLYQASDLFVLPTRADCYSLVAMEAMASGLPVIISRLGGIGDIVEDGTTGILLPPPPPSGGGDANCAALTEALLRLVEDSGLRHRMGEAARRRAVERFDSRSGAARILTVMKGAAAGAARRRTT